MNMALLYTRGIFATHSALGMDEGLNIFPAFVYVANPSLAIEHALSCNCGGFPIMRHNELRDLTASLLDEICTRVGIEPTLQPLSNEQMRFKSANVDDGARLDVIAEVFWGTRQHTFFDVRVFNPFAPSLRNTSIVTLYCQKEQEKRRSYDECIREVEHGSFALLSSQHQEEWDLQHKKSSVQEDCVTNSKQTEEALLPHHQLHPLQDNLLPTQISHHVPKRLSHHLPAFRSRLQLYNIGCICYHLLFESLSIDYD